MRQTKRAIQAFKKQVDGLLCGVEIAAIRKQYGLSQDQAARLCGGGPVAFSKYENDDVVQSESMDSLLRLIRKSSDAFWSLVAEKGLRDELVKVTPVSVQVVGGHLRMTLTSEQPNPSYTPHDFRRAQSPVENVKCQG
jgi:HTH-type transcriptional regulator/antitoxin MqsA